MKKFVKKFVIDRQTDRQTDKQTNRQTAVFIDMPPACKKVLFQKLSLAA